MAGVCIRDLEDGAVARIKLSTLGRLADEATITVGRAIRRKELNPVTIRGRVYILREEALRYLKGKEYRRDFTNPVSLERMENARAHKVTTQQKET